MCGPSARRLAEVLGVAPPDRLPGRLNENARKNVDLCIAEREDANVSFALGVLKRELRGERYELADLVAEAGHMVPPEILLGYRCGRNQRLGAHRGPSLGFESFR